MQQVSALLEKSLGSGQWTADVQKEVSTQLESPLKEQEEAIHRECVRLMAAGRDKKALGDMIAVLAVPLLSSKDRNDLRKAYLDIIKSSKSAPEGGGKLRPAGNDRQTDDDAYGSLTQYLKQWKDHPALTILRGAGVVKSRADSTMDQQSDLALAKLGDEVRCQLGGGIQDEINKGLGDTNRCLHDERSHPPLETRCGRSQADRLLRAAAPLGDGLWRDRGPDPADLLRSLDFHYLALWHEQRTLDDFWGPAADGQPPYFQIAAKNLWKSAQELCKDDEVSKNGKTCLPNLLQDRIDAHGKTMLETRDVAAGQRDENSQHQFVVTLGTGLPLGEAAVAAVYLQEGAKGRTVPVVTVEGPGETNQHQRLGIAVAKVGTVSTPLYSISQINPPAEISALQAVLLYRGHVWPQPCGGDVNIVYRRIPAKTTITVSATPQNETAIELILDCSGSMITPVAGGGSTRLDVRARS